MFRIELQGLAEAQATLRAHPERLRRAARNAINDTARVAQRDLINYQGLVFDRPTPYIQRSIQVQRASSDKLVARLEPVYPGGKGVEPRDVLRAEVEGGSRKLKRSERAFQRVGILPTGLYMVPSRDLLAGPHADAYGNVKGSFIVQLISYFQAFGEQGYRANMTPRRIANLARRKGPKVGPPRRYAHIGGVEYFVSHGKTAGAAINVDRHGGKDQHLPAGIWQRSGTHGVDVRPVFLFVRAPRYQVRYRMGDIVRDATDRELQKRFAQQLAIQAGQVRR